MIDPIHLLNRKAQCYKNEISITSENIKKSCSNEIPNIPILVSGIILRISKYFHLMYNFVYYI